MPTVLCAYHVTWRVFWHQCDGTCRNNFSTPEMGLKHLLWAQRTQNGCSEFSGKGTDWKLGVRISVRISSGQDVHQTATLCGLTSLNCTRNAAGNHPFCSRITFLFSRDLRSHCADGTSNECKLQMDTNGHGWLNLNNSFSRIPNQLMMASYKGTVGSSKTALG